LAILFVTMIGYGVTLPVLPFYVERLVTAGGASREFVAFHVGMLTAVYAVMQLVCAPVWGRWSDRIGRRPFVLLGITGYAVAQLLFGLATSLWVLYLARIAGGILSSATLPAAAAYVTDSTTDDTRARGMAWLGAAVNLGVILGPALGALFVRADAHADLRVWHFRADGFSVPFFVAAALAVPTVPTAVRWLPESLPVRAARAAGPTADEARSVLARLRPLLALALLSQFGLTVFEATFALHAQEALGYGPDEMAAVFVVCGLTMAVFQIGAVGHLGGRRRERLTVAAGFGVMGFSLAILTMPRAMPAILVVVGLLGTGMALIAPNLASWISRRGRAGAGAALGAQNAANSLGQAGGSLFGSALFAWRMEAPYVLTGAVLAIAGVMLARRAVTK
jgi:DHA1 family multidrug resistance protein-like MFS transporter